MKKLIAVLILLAGGFGLSACNALVLNGESDQVATIQQSVAADHPALTVQEQRLPCFECHKEVTPEIYTDWYNSGHGIGCVKCYQCHGTYEELTKVPAMDRCAVCHAGEMDHSAAMPCWACHLTHKFTGHTK